ncbi:MAG: DUF5694 domain-containing protein [Pseudomonadota bacterium]
MRLPAVIAIAFSLAACASAPAIGDAQSPAPIEVMVVGTWHFAGSDSDIVSAKTDSVLTPRRQQELDEVAERLAAFRPTVIVTERAATPPDYVDPKYASFTQEELAANENERVQIAYRLAAKAGVARVVGLDEQPSDGEPDYFPFAALIAHAEATGQGEALNETLAEVQTMVGAETARLSALTMREALIEANRGALSSPDFYYEILKFDAGEAQPAAELNGYWFMRNAKIFSKLIDVTKPGDRVIVIFGAGHKHWFDHLAERTPGFAKVDPVPFLSRPQ